MGMSSRQIGPYRIISLLGKGGMGEVYLAEDPRLGRKIAVKLLGAAFTRDEDRLRRFEQEARAASALNHPNILTIYDIGEAEGTLFIATEYIEGNTLRRRIPPTGMALREALEIAVQVAGALAAAHAGGIAHRDIKPENIMLRRDGYVKVLDFGLAKLVERGATSTDTSAPTVAVAETDPGRVVGTAQYMSPEQARGLKVDERTDIFSLGVVLYEMVAGRGPFTVRAVGSGRFAYQRGAQAGAAGCGSRRGHSHYPPNQVRQDPLHTSTRDVMADYARRRDRFVRNPSSPCFFLNDHGRRMEGSAVRRTFYDLSRQIGLRGPEDHKGPRLHDFRHRFAVRTLVQWYRSNQDIERRLPVLSTFLGHGHVADTYWYLSVEPELMGLATRRLELRWGIAHEE
jgi:serine/threonine protein kinase